MKVMPEKGLLHHISPSFLRHRPRKYWLAILVSVLCALGVLVLAERSYNTLMRVAGERQQLQLVSATIDALGDDLTLAESSQRGYLLTGDTRYLEPFKSAAGRIAARTNLLRGMAPLPLRESPSLRDMYAQMELKLGEMNRAIELRTHDGPDAAQRLVNTDAGKQYMEAFRSHRQLVSQAADALIARKQVEFNRLLSATRLSFMACVLAALLAFVLYLGQTYRIDKLTRSAQRATEEERARLERQVRERTARLTDLASYLQTAVEDERARLARELHDELGALLTAAKLDVARLRMRLPADAGKLADDLAHLSGVLNEGIALKRTIIENLRPSALTNLGLVPALENLTREWSHASRIEVHTALEPVELDESRALAVYRLVQEALTNIQKYARPSRVAVRLDTHDGIVEVSVVDDGVGFDPSNLPLATHGLTGMQHRLDACGGRLVIDSAPGRGTRITGTLAQQPAPR